MNKCVLCRRCVRTCIDFQEVGVLEAVNRGDETKIATFMDKPLADVVCINCGQCINRCPTGALRANDPTDEVWAAIDDPTKHVVIQTAPSPRAGIGECFGLAPGTPLTFEMNTALRHCGFDKVFDTNFTADLTIIEEGTELLLRLYKALVQKDAAVKLPQFTSCSPGWVKYIEHFYPEYLGHMSSAKSPQQMFGALIKTYYAKLNNIDPANIVTVALMPCSAKKFECNRPEMCDSGYKDVDYGLTTRELAKMIQRGGHRPAEDAQVRLRRSVRHGHRLRRDLRRHRRRDGSGAAHRDRTRHRRSRSRTSSTTRTSSRCAASTASSTPRSPIPKVGPVPDLLKHLVPNWDWLKGATLKVGVAHGTANAHKVMEDIKAGGKFSQCHFIEFMACPGGCLGGGGQPIPTSPEIRAARAKAIYSEDSAYQVRKSHENPAVLKIYGEFLTDGPCGHKSHKLLHTQLHRAREVH